jgi:hypothetical protein
MSTQSFELCAIAGAESNNTTIPTINPVLFDFTAFPSQRLIENIQGKTVSTISRIMRHPLSIAISIWRA